MGAKTFFCSGKLKKRVGETNEIKSGVFVCNTVKGIKNQIKNPKWNDRLRHTPCGLPWELRGSLRSCVLWTWPEPGRQWRRWLSTWRNASGWCWACDAICAMFWLGRTFCHCGTCCRRRPDRICGFRHRGRVEYEPRRDQCPKTRQKFDDQLCCLPERGSWKRREKESVSQRSETKDTSGQNLWIVQHVNVAITWMI